ncbi:MAG: DUF418 domain-containing protein [Hyphomonas sp.]
MADTGTDTGPGPQAARIEAIDALRGFALIGIYFINITIMGGPINSEQPSGLPALSDPDWATWLTGHMFVYGSMRGIFSMLFGASALLFLRDPGRPPALFVRRCFWLLCFGVLNSTLLLWPGDILLVYALASPIVLLFLKASPARLLIAGGAILAAISVWSVWAAWPDAAGPAEPEDAAAAASALAAEQAARLGSYGDNLAFLLQTAMDWTFSTGLLWWVADAAGFMLVGMALFRLGVFSGGLNLSVYAMMALVGFGLGLPLRAWEGLSAMANGGEFPPLAEASFQLGRLAVSLGWVGAFMLAWRCLWHGLFAPLSALGRMAFTGYLAQSVIAACLFSGFGLGLWNRLHWPQLWALVPLIMGLMALCFMAWLRVFRMGPLEWLWRWLTFGKAPALRRAA